MKRVTKPKVKGVRCWAILTGEDFARSEYDEGLPLLFIDKQDAIDMLVSGDRLILVEISPIPPKQKRRTRKP